MKTYQSNTCLASDGVQFPARTFVGSIHRELLMGRGFAVLDDAKIQRERNKQRWDEHRDGKDDRCESLSKQNGTRGGLALGGDTWEPCVPLEELFVRVSKMHTPFTPNVVRFTQPGVNDRYWHSLSFPVACTCGSCFDLKRWHFAEHYFAPRESLFFLQCVFYWQ